MVTQCCIYVDAQHMPPDGESTKKRILKAITHSLHFPKTCGFLPIWLVTFSLSTAGLTCGH